MNLSLLRGTLAYLAALTIAAPQAAMATANAKASIPAVTLENAPPLDLDFSTGPFAQAPAIEGFETLTTRTAATRFPTTARIALDKNNIYVAISATQVGAPITATQSTNNVGFGIDDFVGIGLDTTGNGQTYYFETTPAGVRYQVSVESVRYNPQWVAYTKVKDGNWKALLVIPIKVLRTGAGSVQLWRFNIIRHIAATNENETWAYDPLMNDGGGTQFPVTGDARFWPYLEGVHVGGSTVKPRPRAEVYALGSAGHDRNVYQQATGVFAPEGTRNLGLDVNIPLTGTIAFVGALAPDFSNVETDQQTIAPQEFRRSFSEYRPFFTQGASFFNQISLSAINQAANVIFYSPGIGEFERGTKVEGTFGYQSIGVLNVGGAGFNDTAIGYKHYLPDRTFAYSFDAVSAHHADGNSTAYPYADNDVTYEAQVGGRNLHTGLVYNLDYGGEHGSVPGTTPGLAYKTEDFLDVHKQNLEIYTSYRDIGPNWNPIDGFTNISDIRGPGSFIDLTGNPPAKSPLKRAELFVFGDRLVDRSGAAHQVDLQVNGSLLFRNQLSLSGGSSYSALRLYDHGLYSTGFPIGYTGGVTVPFNASNVAVGYKDGTPTPYDVYAQWGPFTTFNGDGTVRPTYLRLYTLSTSRPLGSRYSISFEFDGSQEEFPTANVALAAHDSQELRRIGFGEAFGAESNLSISLRDISGTGGFSSPGVNLAASYHQRFANDSELFVNYGTPSASATLQRVIVKYVYRFGSAAGT